MFIFAPEMKVWTDLSSLQPRKKMLKHVFLTPFGQSFLQLSPLSFFIFPIFNFQFIIFNLKRWDIYLHPNRCLKDTPTR